MTDKFNPDFKKKLAKISMLLLDVDGVLTDGSIVYTDSGEELKTFNVRDGLGIRMLMDAGITVGIITGRSSGALLKRCENLGIGLVFQGVKDKLEVLKKILDTFELTTESIAFAGDDLPDIRIMKAAGFSIAVANADPAVKSVSDYITEKEGGNGAVREICELILKAKDMWDKTMERFI